LIIPKAFIALPSTRIGAALVVSLTVKKQARGI
jgi:hypothetical protein